AEAVFDVVLVASQRQDAEQPRAGADLQAVEQIRTTCAAGVAQREEPRRRGAESHLDAARLDAVALGIIRDVAPRRARRGDGPDNQVEPAEFARSLLRKRQPALAGRQLAAPRATSAIGRHP